MSTANAVSTKWLLGVMVTICITLTAAMASLMTDQHDTAVNRIYKLESHDQEQVKSIIEMKADVGYIVKAIEDMRGNQDLIMRVQEEQRQILQRVLGEVRSDRPGPRSGSLPGFSRP